MKFFSYVPGPMPVPKFNLRRCCKWLFLSISLATSVGCNRLQTQPVDTSHPAHPGAAQAVIAVMPDTLKSQVEK